MLASEIITFCNEIWEPDEASPAITDAQWLKYLNECLNESRPFLRIQGVGTINLVSGTASYDLPSDFDFLYKAWDTSGTTSKTMREVTFRPNLSSNHFYIFNDDIYIKAPTANATDGLTLLYNKIHPTLSTGTTILIEDPYMLAYYALSRVAMAYKNASYEMYYSEFQLRRDELIAKQDGIEYTGNEQSEKKREVNANVGK